MPADRTYVFLTYHLDRNLIAYGTYDSDMTAGSASAEVGFTDDTVLTSVVVELQRPQATRPVHEIITNPAPDGLLADFNPEVTPSGPVIILTADASNTRFALTGPFPDVATGAAWLDSATPPRDGTWHSILALREGPRPHPDQDNCTCVLVVAGPSGRFAYGPFPDTLHTTAWGHQLASLLDPSRHHIAVHQVAEPFDLSGEAPTRCDTSVRPATTALPDTYPDHSHVVLLHDDSGAATVGFFANLGEASGWSASQTQSVDDGVAFTPLPVLSPFPLPERG
jgi:hypothetical protein